MAITLFTGLPGNGKTLRALWQIKVRSEKENRQVYYDGITILDEVALPWIKFDAKEWMKLPPGSIIVIDEAQDTFPAKANGSTLPDHYNDLAKHRHFGFDIYVITQHPSLIHNFVRKLVAHHFHSIRKFGMQRSNVWEWQSANDNPEKPSSHKTAILHKFKYPKQVYGWYKSAEVHTVKRSVPMKLVLGVLFVIGMIALGYYALDRFQSRAKQPDVPVVPGGVPGAVGHGVGSAVGSAGAAVAAAFDPVADARSFVYSNTPRVAGLPHTAPKYDELTKPNRVPVPAACIQRGRLDGPNGVTCKCYSQQGTAMGVPIDMCMAFARDGYFQEFDVDRGGQDQRQAPVQAQQIAQVSDVGGARVAVFPDAPRAAPESRPISK
jgi:zona occludens toxin